MKIVADSHIPFLRGVLEPYADVTYRPGQMISQSDVSQADALIIRTRTECDAKLLSGTKVRFVASATTGFDHVNIDFCRQNGIDVSVAPGCNSSSVLQYVAAALGELSKRDRIPLHERTIGVVGVGHVGSKVADYCELLGMRVLRNDPPRERKEGGVRFVSIEKVLEESDIITLHVPLTYEGKDRTRRLFDSEVFSSLKRKPILINTSRGGVVEAKALKAALSEKRVSGSVLDVWENEPAVDQALLSMVDIGTPHIAGYSADGKANGVAMSIRAVSRHFDLPLNDWYPPRLPVPARRELEVDAAGLSSEDVVRSAVLRTYDIQMDDRRFRSSTDSFEEQRGDYPLRREFETFTANVLNDRENVASLLRQIGFQVNKGE